MTSVARAVQMALRADLTILAVILPRLLHPLPHLLLPSLQPPRSVRAQGTTAKSSDIVS